VGPGLADDTPPRLYQQNDPDTLHEPNPFLFVCHPTLLPLSVCCILLLLNLCSLWIPLFTFACALYALCVHKYVCACQVCRRIIITTNKPEH
jgi:hypothetical protein